MATQTQYLLICDCGKEHTVDATQAGLSVPCSCGRTLTVPTLRHLTKLRRVEAKSPTAQARGNWTPREGLLLAGAVLIVCGLSAALYFRFKPPAAPDAERIEAFFKNERLSMFWEHWQILKRGPDWHEQNVLAAFVNRVAADYSVLLDEHRRRMYIALVVTLIGVAIAGIGVGVGVLSKPRPQKAKKKSGRKGARAR